MLRDMPLFVKPVFRDSRMCEKSDLPAIKRWLVVYHKVSPFLCLLSALWHIDTQLSLAKPDKDKYDTRDKKQHNLQQLIKQPGPA